jgi:hypothetical protein
MSCVALHRVGQEDWLLRELHRAQMIVSSPCGTWPQSLVALSEKLLCQWAGWNVSSFPSASANSPSGTYARNPAGHFSSSIDV